MRAVRRRQFGQRPGLQRGFGCLAGFVFLVVVAAVLVTVGSLLASLGTVAAAIAIAGGFLIVFATGRGLRGAARSLDRIVEATRRVEDGDYTVRLGRPESDLHPIHQLAAGFDTMVARLETDEEQRRGLLADISHELRTPLSVITGNLEAIVDGVYPADAAHLTPILDETRVLERLIDDLRTVTLSEAGTLPLHPEPTDPDVLIGDVVRAFAPTAAAAGVTLTTTVDGALPILEIDPVRIREVLANLVANALRHTPSRRLDHDRRVGLRDGGRPDRHRYRAGDRACPAAVRVRSVREGRGITWLGARATDRAGPGRGPRRHDRRRGPGRWRDHVPRPPSPSYGRVIRTSSTAASTMLGPARSAASNTIRTV